MSTAEATIPRKVWTRRELTLFDGTDLNLELINGELIDRSRGKQPSHNYWKTLLQGWFIATFGAAFVRIEDSMDVSPEDNPTSEPEPDLVLTNKSIHEDGGAPPQPSDVRLVIEVSGTTYAFDRDVKGPLYARALVQQYWIVDVRQKDEPRLAVYTKPLGGRYTEVQTLALDGETDVGDYPFRLNKLKPD